MYHSDTEQHHQMIQVPLQVQQRKSLEEVHYPMLNLEMVRMPKEMRKDSKYTSLAQAWMTTQYTEISMNEYLEALDLTNS